jgi:2,4-dienoyl-CoA reductase-like NADH-dependent reductase (Old Yellow Enzyme family)
MRQGDLLAPSPRPDVPAARAMTEGEISDLAQAYIQAGRRSWEAGMDGVQIHSAHGYFVNQMISPLTNKRSDRYGGSLEGRSLFLREVIEGIRSITGPEYPIHLKIAGHDETPGGLTAEDTVRIVEMAVESGLSAVEVSGGMPFTMNIKKPADEAHEGIFLKEAALFKKHLSIPVISVHGFRTLSRMQEALQQRRADMVSLCRPFIRQPDLVSLLREGSISQVTCISCNLCLKDRGPLRCMQEEKKAPAQ